MVMLNYIVSYLKSLSKKEEGQAMVEYGLIIALIAIAVIGALVLLGPQIAKLFEQVGEKLPEVPASS